MKVCGPVIPSAARNLLLLFFSKSRILVAPLLGMTGRWDSRGKAKGGKSVIVRKCCLDEPQKILVRATNWLGDAVMSLPALEALRSRFPEAEIVVLSKPWVSELYWRHPAVTRQIVYDPSAEHRGARGFWKLVQQLRTEHFDAAILFQNAFHAAGMTWLARI